MGDAPSPLALDQWGDGPVVVLLHGMPSPPAHYERLARALAPHYRVLVPHLPGYGRSPRPARDWTLDARDAALVAALRGEGVEAAHLVGFSAGAWVALRLALRTPLRPQSVFALGGFGDVDAEMARELGVFADALDAGEDLAPVAGPRFLSDAFRERHPDAVGEVEGWIRCVAPDDLCRELRRVAAAAGESGDALPTLGCPLTARTGAEDVAVPLRRAEALAAAVPAGAVQRVAGAGHALLLEDFDKTAVALLRHLEHAEDPRRRAEG